MSSTSLVVPLALWNAQPISPVTTVVYKNGHIVTGLRNGNIWIYRCKVEEGEVKLEHKILCTGHKFPVSALTTLEGQTDGSTGNDYAIMSASEDGEIIKWCLLDGRCISTVARAFDGIPKSLIPLASSAQPAKFVLCSGFSSEITILNCMTLEVVRVWAGHNDWTVCTPFYDSDARQTRLLTSNFNGKLRIWAFDEHKETITKVHEVVGSLDAQGDKICELVGNPFDIGVMLAISGKCAIIFAVQRDKVLHIQSITPPKSTEFWASGAFLSKTLILLWTKTGEAYLYLLPVPSERNASLELAQGISGPTMRMTARRSSLPPHANTEDATVSTPSRPLLLEAVYHTEDGPKIHQAITTVFKPTAPKDNLNSWYSITFRNRLEDTSFAWKLLSTNYAGANDKSQSVWSPEKSLASIWPLNDANSKLTDPKILLSANVYDERIAFGYENGDIRIVPIRLVLTESKDILNSQDVQLLSGHVGRVTCIYAPNICNFEKKYLVSGGKDCSVRIWSLENGKRLAIFTVHSQQVKRIFEPPPDVGPRIRKCVISVAKDNSLAIISLEEMTCHYVFGGYPYPIMGIQWRPSEDRLLLTYGDESVHIWKMSTGELEGIVGGAAAREMISDKQWKVSRIALGESDRASQSKTKTLTSLPIDFPENATSPLHIFLINVKQLVADIYHHHVSPGFVSPKANGINEAVGVTNELDEKPISQSKILSYSITRSSISSEQSLQESDDIVLDASVVQVIISALMSRGINTTLDRIFAEKLGLKRPGENISFGIRGANGNLSIVAPSPGDGKNVWQISPTLTATHLLSIVGSLRSFLSMKGSEKYCDEIMTHYESMLPRLVGQNFCHASLYFLAKYFQDPSVDVKQAARALFSSSLIGMPSEEQQKVIDFWKQFLPAVTSRDAYTNQYVARSTILLAVIGVNHPEVLHKNTRVAKSVALSLALLLNDSKLPHRLAALELCGKGFSTWENHFNAAAVLRTLFTFATDSDTNNVTPVKAMARQALFQIAVTNTPLFVSTLTCDIMSTKKPVEKNGYLKLLSQFIRKNPSMLHSSLPNLVEVVVKSLDPNIPNLRETVLQTTTTILHDLVKAFSSVAFHGRLQKLAVGTLEGAAIVYDLRTATRCHILEGHTRPITAISFSDDGKLIASCSLDERTVRFWNLSPGLLGMFTGSLATGAVTSTPAALSSSITPVRTFRFNTGDNINLSTQSILDTVRFEWVGERNVKLYVVELTMSFNV